MADPCTCSCNCLDTITIPCCTSATGATGPAGANGGAVLYNNFDVSSLPTNGSFVDLSPSKTYTLTTTQIASLGDRIKIEVVGVMKTATTNMPAIKIVFDNNIVGLHTLQAKEDKVIFKITTVLDFAAATGSASNVAVWSICDYYTGGATPYPSPIVNESTILSSFITVDYNSAPAKIIKVQGIMGAVAPGVNEYAKCTQMCIEYFKKI